MSGSAPLLTGHVAFYRFSQAHGKFLAAGYRKFAKKGGHTDKVRPMARVADIALSLTVAAYAYGSAPAQRMRPIVFERPFAQFHNGVNHAANQAARTTILYSQDFGTVLRQTILGNTFLGRASS